MATDLVGTLERRFYDFASTSSARVPSDRIAVIAIDDQSIANIGRWPWGRDVHAKLIDMLAAAKAKTIVQTAFFFEPQVDPGLQFIRKMKILAEASPATEGGNAPLLQLIAQAEQTLDTDATLAQSMKAAGNVLLPSVYVLGEPQGRADEPLPEFATKSAIDETAGYSILAQRGQQPLSELGLVAAGVGHLNQFPDVDGAVRTEPLLVNYYGKAIPSIALLAAAHSLNLTTKDIQLNVGESVQLGRLKVKTDELGLMLAPVLQRD